MENAVVHAFDDGSSGYRIVIRACITGADLQITVRYNGKGMSREEVDQLTANMERTDLADENIGLVNVYQRIRLFYGDACGIGITSRLGEGTEIRDHPACAEAFGEYGKEQRRGRWHTKF